MNIKAELEKALQEIGEIKPWWSEEDQMFIFEHEAYPFVMHADPDLGKTIAGYKRALKGFISDRMSGQLDATVDRATSGHGGLRVGAGRPKNQIPTIQIRLPLHIAQWIQDPEHIKVIEKLMHG
jgi:hypothetical protein